MRGLKDQNLIVNARKLRHEQTPWENKLWYLLRNRRFKEFKFRRQYPIGRYVVDFICIARKLIIELDGSGHITLESKDIQRDIFLRNLGYSILRFWNNDLDNNLEGVLNKIYAVLKLPLTRPSGTLSLKGERKRNNYYPPHPALSLKGEGTKDKYTKKTF